MTFFWWRLTAPLHRRLSSYLRHIRKAETSASANSWGFVAKRCVFRVFWYLMSVVLGAGDRPIEITIERMWSALCWRKRLQLLRALLQGGKQDEVHREAAAASAATADGAVAGLVAQLSGSFPEVSGGLASSCFMSMG